MITSDNFFSQDYIDVANLVIGIYESLPADVTPTSNARAAFAGCIVRAAGHDFMDFRYNADGSTSGGSDGCINFNDPDNAGLRECL